MAKEDCSVSYSWRVFGQWRGMEGTAMWGLFWDGEIRGTWEVVMGEDRRGGGFDKSLGGSLGRSGGGTPLMSDHKRGVCVGGGIYSDSCPWIRSSSRHQQGTI